jgi:hypothetical protein
MMLHFAAVAAGSDDAVDVVDDDVDGDHHHRDCGYTLTQHAAYARYSSASELLQAVAAAAAAAAAEAPNYWSST